MSAITPGIYIRLDEAIERIAKYRIPSHICEDATVIESQAVMALKECEEIFINGSGAAERRKQ